MWHKGRDIALRCPRPRSSGRNDLPNVAALYIRFRRLTLRSATGTAQRAGPYLCGGSQPIALFPHGKTMGVTSGLPVDPEFLLDTLRLSIT